MKADKKAEIERNERVLQQQIERDEEMREMAIKIRRRFVNLNMFYPVHINSDV